MGNAENSTFVAVVVVLVLLWDVGANVSTLRPKGGASFVSKKNLPRSLMGKGVQSGYSDPNVLVFFFSEKCV